MANRALLYVVTIAFTLTGSMSDAAERSISRGEAVTVAEQFISDNGYTEAPAVKERYVPESLERTPEIDLILQGRRGTLEEKAYGVSQGRRGSKSGWTVVFAFKQPCKGCNPNNGRAVTMDSDGTNIRVEHVDFILSEVEQTL